MVQAKPTRDVDQGSIKNPRMEDPLTSNLRPATDSLLVVRVIKSFPYRTFKNLILPHVDLTTTTVGDLKKQIKEEIQKQLGFKPFRTVEYDTLKIYVKAHGFKTQNLIMNLDHEDWTLHDHQTLQEAGCENETTLSFYNHNAYDEFKKNPEEKWM